MSWIEGLLRQEPLHDTPQLVEILAALEILPRLSRRKPVDSIPRDQEPGERVGNQG